MSYVAFLGSAVMISLSGVMAPGPITAVTLGQAARSPHAGAIIAVGHAIVEFPLLLVIWYGTSYLRDNLALQAAIGLTGGLFLLLMGIGMLRSAASAAVPSARTAASALLAGIVLTAGNPYFLLWWATVGANMVIDAVAFGLLGLAVFAVAHWLCDLGWLWFLSAAGYKGGQFFGHRFQKATFVVCGVFLVAMSGKFIADAARLAWGPQAE